MRRGAILFAVWASAAWGQLALFTAESERPVGNVLSIGSVTVGDVLSARLRLRNTGAAAANVTMLSVGGSGFTLAGAPPLPQRLAAGAALDFDVRFEPPLPGAYSASLLSDNISTILVATATAAPVLSVDDSGNWRTLASGATVAFGTVERGSTAKQRFLLANRTGETLGPLQAAVAGDAFAAPAALANPFALGPGETMVFEVSCTPRVTGVLEGTLSIGPRRFMLQAQAVEPPLPRPEIVISLPEARSARQGRVSVRLASPSRGRASGQVKLDFEPAAPALPPDPAMTFASGARLASFSVEEGDTAVRFGSHSYLDFQTGSTAGTLVFTLDAPGYHERAAVAVAPAAVDVSSARAGRIQSGLEVVLTGLDNTCSASHLTFTFFGKNGATLPPGAIQVDAAAAFAQYFKDSAVGGLFSLRAVFPLSGDASEVDSVEAEIVNSAGASRTTRLPF